MQAQEHRQPIVLLFAKAGAIANRPGLTQKQITDKRGVSAKRWVRSSEEAPKEREPAAADPDPRDERGAAHGYGTHNVEPGDHVAFEAGAFSGHGEVVSAGKDGVQVKDASGRVHGVHWNEVRGFKGADGGQGGKPPSDSAAGEVADKGADDGKPKSAEEIARALFNTSELENLPPKARQPVDSWEELTAKAPEGLKQFSAMLNKVASALDLVTGKRPQSHDFAIEEEKRKAAEKGRAAEELPQELYMLPEHWDDPRGYLFMGPLKGKDRAVEKVTTDYRSPEFPDGDWGQLRDMVRATIAVPAVTQIPKVLSELKKAGIELAQKPKNNLVKPLPGGYRDLNLIVKLPNGLVAELQVHVKPMTLAKEKGHEHYETTRSIEAKYAKDGKTHPKEHWDAEDQAKHAEAMKHQEKIYGEAWEKATSAVGENDEPLRKSAAEPILLLWKREGGKR